jgi:predicted nuclease of predicted toxin-antitoxin system
MIIVADESVDGPVVSRLRQDGHEVVYIAEISPGISDDEVLGRANALNALLLTADKDFGVMVFSLKRISHGVVLTRLSGLATLTKADMVSNAFAQHANELEGTFTVISAGQTRIREQLDS